MSKKIDVAYVFAAVLLLALLVLLGMGVWEQHLRRVQTDQEMAERAAKRKQVEAWQEKFLAGTDAASAPSAQRGGSSAR